MAFIPAQNNLPVEARNRVLEPNQYYWIKTGRTPYWFPAKRVANCWFVAGKEDPLTEEVLHVGNILVCPHA